MLYLSVLYQYASSFPGCTAAKVLYFSAISVCVLIFRLYCSKSSVFQCYISMRPHFPTVLQQKFCISVLYQYASTVSGCTAAKVRYFRVISACVLIFRLYCSKSSVFNTERLLQYSRKMRTHTDITLKFSVMSVCVLVFRLYCSKRFVFQCYINMCPHALTLFVLQI